MAEIQPSIDIGNDISSYRITGSAADRYYTTPADGFTLVTLALAANIIIAIPFISPRNITLDTIAVNVTTGTFPVISNIRLGIYADNGNLYPDALILDAGTVSSTLGGVKTIAINQQLNKNRLYWLVLLTNGTPTLRATPIAAALAILGYSNALGATPGTGYAVAFAFAALPDPFPAAAAIGSSVAPLVFVRLSA